jgi:5-formyltetrahydrofolate cyclo-ligase
MKSPSDISITSRNQLREELRNKRKAINSKQQAEAAINLLRQLIKFPIFLKAKRIAVYLSGDGEMDLQPLIHQAWAMNKEVYLPVIKNKLSRELWFLRYTPETQLTQNRYKILEPDPHQNPKLAAHLLDIVFMPLVGFDADKNRLGMGGGFYDTTFAFKKQKPKSKPLLIGVAHECQRVEKIDVEEWDIPMNGVITDKNIYSQ